jgi:flagellar biosynthesis protein FlhF
LMTKVKKYRAQDMQDALAQIKADLGSDAIILQSQKTKDGGVFGMFGKPVWEVVAASDRELRLAPECEDYPAQDRRPAGPAKKPAAARAAVLPATPTIKPGSFAQMANDAEGAVSAISAVALETAKSMQVIPDLQAIQSLQNMQNAQTVELKEIRLMLLDLREAMKDLKTRPLSQESSVAAGPVEDLERILLAQGVDESDAMQIIDVVRSELSPEAMANYAIVRGAVKKQLEGSIPVAGPLKYEEGKCQVVFLTGPTGVGKTTTIVKIAANLILGEKRRVLLVTTDTFRVAGVAQLQSYADIIGVELKVAYTPEELKRYIDENGDRDFILVDTPGHSPFDGAHLETLKGFLNAIEEKKVFLTLSSATKYSDMLDAARSFDIDGVDGLVLTKVDETSGHGAILSLLRQTGKPVSYLTHGQNVPYDIQVAKPERVADMLLVNKDGC